MVRLLHLEQLHLDEQKFGNKASDIFHLFVDPRSTTPTTTPPKDFIPLNEANGNTAAAGPAADTSRILKALADMAKSNTPASGIPRPASSGTVTNLQNAFPQNMSSSVNPAPYSVPPATQAVSVPGPGSGANPFPGLMSSAQNFGQNMQSGQTPVQTNSVMPQGTTPEALQQQLQLLQMLQAQGIPQEQWAPLLSVLVPQGGVGAAPNAASQSGWQFPGGYGRDDPSRDHSGYNDHFNMRSPSGRYRDNRSRSRSPSGWDRDRRREPSPPRRRDSPIYGEYGRDGRGGRHGRGGPNEFRRRSPPPYRRSDSPRSHDQALPPPGPKNIQYERSLPPNHIKGKLYDSTDR